MKKIAKILSVVLCMVMVLGLMATTTFAATLSADLDTMAEDTTYGNEHKSSSGWDAKNAQATAKQAVTNGAMCVILNGKTSAVGVLTSPTLSGGIKEISFSYANPFSESNGVDVTITITPVGGTAVTNRLDKDNSAVTKNTAYTYTWTLDTPVEGNYTISIKNNSPSNNTGNKDRVAIWNITWTPTAENVHEHDYSGTPAYEPKNDYQHTVSVSCADATCTVPQTTTEYHNYDDTAKCTLCNYQYVTPETKTIPEAIALGEAAGSNYTTVKYAVTGTITEIANDYYGNVYISDGTNTLYIYGLYNMYGAKGYKDWADADKLAVGDTITIHTALGTHSGTAQAKNAWVASVTRAGTDTPPAGDDDDDKDDDVVVTPPAGGTGNIEGIAPVNGATIKLGLWQNGMGKFLYFNGEVANKYYLGTTEDFTAAVNLTVEQVEDGWLLWFMKDGVKTYITMVASGNYVNAVMVTDVPAPLTWNATHKTFTMNVNGEDYYIGTYTKSDGTNYSTLSASKLSYLPSDTSYASHLYTEQPAKTGDISSVFVALLAVSAIGAGALISKKGKFVA